MIEISKILPARLRVVTHYAEEDEDCDGDYYSIEVFDVITGERVQHFGDYYHDKGRDKSEVFIETINWIRKRCDLPDVEIEDERIADGAM